LQLLVDRRCTIGCGDGCGGAAWLRAGKVDNRGRSRLLRSCPIALGGKRSKGCLRSAQVSRLQGLAEGVESLGAAGIGKRFGAGEGPVLSKHGQGLIGLLSTVQIPTLQSAAKLLKIGLAVLLEGLELLKNR